jgi:hypothetical protein
MRYLIVLTLMLGACEALENGPSYGRNPDPAMIYAMGGGGIRVWTPPERRYAPPPMVICNRAGGGTVICY